MAKRSGPPYRRIVVTFWNDPDVKRVLSLEEKAFLMYLFSNEHCHPCGLYRLSPILVIDELGISEDRMRELLEGPIEPFATYDWRTEEVFVHNMAEHQIDGGLHLKTDNRISWFVRQLETIHSQVLLRAFRDRYSDWSLPWDELIETDNPSTPENPRGSGTMKGVRRGSEGGPNPLTEPGTEGFRRNVDDSEDPDKMAENQEPAWLSHDEGGSKGVGKPEPEQEQGPEPEQEQNGLSNQSVKPTNSAAETEPGESSLTLAESGEPTEEDSEPPGPDEDMSWTNAELRDLADRVLGLDQLDGLERQANSRILAQWIYTDGRSKPEVAAAIEGAAAMRDADAIGWESAGPGDPMSLKALNGPKTLADQGDGQAERPLYDVAVEWARTHGPPATEGLPEVDIDRAPKRADDSAEATKRKLRKQYEDLKRAEAP